MNHRLARAALLCAVLSSSIVAESEAKEWPRVISAPDTPFAGSPSGLEIEGDRLYLTTSSTIAAFDVSDPAAPTFLGVSLTSGTTQRFTVAGGHAYLVGYHAGLNIHDLSSPATSLPRGGGYALTGSASLLGVGVSGSRAFVSGHGTGLMVLDISSPAEPQVVGTAPHDEGKTQYFGGEHIRLVGDKIFLAGHDDDWGALTIYQDVPGGDPVFLGDFCVLGMPGIPPTGTSRRVEVKGQVAYVADTGAGLFMLDVNDPTAPTQLNMPGGGTTLTSSSVDDFALSGDLIVAANQFTFSVLDVSTPSAPEFRSELSLEEGLGFSPKIAVSGTTAYLAGDRVLSVIDFSDAAKPALLASIEISGRRERDVEIVGNLAYVAGDGGIGVFDLSGPLPVEVGRSEAGSYQRLVVSGNKAVAQHTDNSNVSFFDLGPEGTTPQLRDTLLLPSIRSFDLDGNRFYLRRPNGGLDTYDVSNLSGPRLIGHWEEQDQYFDFIQVRGPTAFVGSQPYGFAIYDISDPHNLSLLGALGGVRFSRFMIEGDLVYGSRWGADSDHEIVIIDISNPGDPRELGSLAAPGNSGYVSDLSMANGFLFATMSFGDTTGFIVDVSNPSDPVIVRNTISHGRIDHLEAHDSRLYLAHGFLGLHVLDSSLGVPQLNFTATPGLPHPVRLGWDAPNGIPFPLEKSRNLREWTPLGRFTDATLQEAFADLFAADPSLPGFFRATER